MYLRRCYRNKDGKRHGYWALVESYRSSRGPRQRVVAYLGWGSGWGDCWARTLEQRERLRSRLIPIQTVLRSVSGKESIAGGSGHDSVKVVMCCAAT